MTVNVSYTSVLMWFKSLGLVKRYIAPPCRIGTFIVNVSINVNAILMRLFVCVCVCVRVW